MKLVKRFISILIIIFIILLISLHLYLTYTGKQLIRNFIPKNVKDHINFERVSYGFPGFINLHELKIEKFGEIDKVILDVGLEDIIKKKLFVKNIIILNASMDLNKENVGLLKSTQRSKKQFLENIQIRNSELNCAELNNLGLELHIIDAEINVLIDKQSPDVSFNINGKVVEGPALLKNSKFVLLGALYENNDFKGKLILDNNGGKFKIIADLKTDQSKMVIDGNVNIASELLNKIDNSISQDLNILNLLRATSKFIDWGIDSKFSSSIDLQTFALEDLNFNGDLIIN